MREGLIILQSVLGFLFGILAVAFAFGFIVFIHELGHFVTARWADIYCPQFAIGFGPRLFGFRWRGTDFSIRAFPLGGYVLMNGEEPGDRENDPWAAAVGRYLGEVSFPASRESLLAALEQIPDSERGREWENVRDQVRFARSNSFSELSLVEGCFHDRSIAARILVISGGVIMNFVSAILLLWFLGPVVGLGSLFRDWSATISQAVDGTPAAVAGLKPGDRIVSVDGKEVSTHIQAFHSIGAFVGKQLPLVVQRRTGERIELKVLPDIRIGSQVFRLEQSKLVLRQDSQSKELIGKVVETPSVEELLKTTTKLIGQKKATYQVKFAGVQSPTTFELTESFTGPRGQIGVKFGLGDVRFESSLTGTISAIESGSLADSNGLKVGDQILAVGGLLLESNSGLIFGSLADQAVEQTAKVEQIDTFEIDVVREGKLKTVSFLNSPERSTIKELGITLQPVTGRDLMAAPFKMIGQMMAGPFMIVRAWLSAEYTGKEIVENMQGPIGIMSLLHQLSDNGLWSFLYFVALLNGAIGAFNLLPFPALDGSRLFFLMIAGIRGRAVNPNTEAKIHLTGMMILLTFVAIVSLGDIKRLISSHLFVL